jgi:AraC-like DNA-binding protein
VLVMLPFYLEPASEKILVLENPQVGRWSDLLFFLNDLKYPYSLAYIIAILVVIRRHRALVKETLSYLDRVNLNWIRNVTIGGILVWVVALGSYLIGLSGDVDGKTADPIEGFDDYVMLASAIFVYTIGFMGLRQPEIFTLGRTAESTELIKETVPVASESSEENVDERYSKSGFSLSEASELKVRLLNLMTSERPYRNSKLTLPDLAAMLETTTHHLSQTLNSQIEANFYDFVNSYRVDEVKSRLADPSSRHLTILSIGLDAGFNSKSSFNSVFKKQTGMSPSEYRSKSDPN